MNLDKIIKEAIDNYIESDNIASAGSYIFCKNKNNEWCILAGKRGATAPSCPNMFNIPVGMREYYETPQECAQRECYEETNLNIDINKFQYIDKEEWARGKFGANFLVMLDGICDNYKIGMGDGENDRFHWIPISQINSVPWAFGMNKNVLRYYPK